MGAPPVDLKGVQGLVRSGYRHLTAAVFILFTIEDPARARGWLGELDVTVTRILQTVAGRMVFAELAVAQSA